MFSVLTVLDDTGDPADDLTTVADVLEALNEDGDSVLNAQLQSWISRYSKVIASWCNRDFAKKFVKQTYYLDQCEWVCSLLLDRYPATEVFSVTVDDDVISATDYAFNPASGVVHSLCGGWTGRKIEVEYNGGYDLPDDAPAPLAQACIEFVKDQKLVQGRDPTIREISQGDSSVSYWVGTRTGTGSDALPPGVEDLISPFRRLTV